ncbi:alpha/beta hydrolase [Enterococcus saccharolyticus]|uniref:alpha/beta hydrolase n=1 Tax=Enterococcus saccharolyticus TaxID=41997 RepID=UPI0039DFF58D
MIEKFEHYFPLKQTFKQIHVYLPDDYADSEERYPVMYMYDGHNLFNDHDATYGTSWGLKDFLEQYDKRLIIVGIECSHNGNERLDEYCPYPIEISFFGTMNGYGDKLMDWVVHDLKAHIDESYRTYPFREATAIGGSSMGGLMAFYSVIAYNSYFSKAACLSPSISLCLDQLKAEWFHHNISPDTRVYFSFGEREIAGREQVLADVGYFNDQLVQQGGTSYIHVQKNGGHNETTWKKQNQLFMDILWK